MTELSVIQEFVDDANGIRGVDFVTDSFRLSELAIKVELKELIVRPKYQRKYVWDKEDERCLIDTCLRLMPIPPVWLVERYKDSGVRYLEVLDGQQRLTALLRFLDNKYPYKKPQKTIAGFGELGCEDSFYSKDMKKSPKLSAVLADRIQNYKVPAIILKNTNDEEVRHVFYRLNTASKELNEYELTSSQYPGVMMDYVKKILINIDHESCLISKTSNSFGRFSGGDVQGDRMVREGFIMEVFTSWARESIITKKDRSIDYFFNEHQNNNALATDYYQRITHAINIINDAIIKIDGYTDKPKSIPLRDLTLFALIFYVDKTGNLTSQQFSYLSDMIKKCRELLGFMKNAGESPNELPEKYNAIKQFLIAGNSERLRAQYSEIVSNILNCDFPSTTFIDELIETRYK